VGNFIASGHVDWERRLAVFWQLGHLREADRVEVLAEDGQRYTYAVQWVREVSAQTSDLQTIIGPSSDRVMTLITCGGAFDPKTRDYASRVIVRARLVPSA
jgi:sortase (surface protein transpeptidase)